MINRKVLYFYEYASEIRGKCLGHARVLVCGHLLKLTLAFSLPEWEKKPCKLYFIAENTQGKVSIVELGEIMPSAIMTVYNLDMEESRLEGICIPEITHVCLFVKDSDNRYIKAVTGIFDITNKTLNMFLSKESKDKESEEETVINIDETNGNKTEAKTEAKKAETKQENAFSDYYVSDKSETIDEKTESEPVRTEGIEQENLCYEQNSELLRNDIVRLMSTRPEYRPFRATGISYSVRIGIGDVIRLSEFEPGLRENSFLLHGFYRYKHILLASGMVRGQVHYYVMVPGVKIEREQKIADMYGFHDFITLDSQPPRPGVFGYYSWLLLSH